MKHLIPVYSEKSMGEAKRGKYTFFVPTTMTKDAVKVAVNEAFGVIVTSVATLTLPKSIRRTMYGKFVTQKKSKKAIVTLKKGQKITLFEEQKGEAKK